MNIRQRKSSSLIIFLLVLVLALSAVSGDFRISRHESLQAELSTLTVAYPATLSIVPIEQNRTKAEVVSMARLYPHKGFRTDYRTRYSQVPQLTAPYSAGALNAEDIADALNAVKMVRYLAGVPYESIAFSDELNNISQHGATLLAASNQFSHSPLKPADMAQAFFDTAYRGCSEANLSAGRQNISNAVLGFMADLGSNNLQYAGHRRWILKPGADYFGIGYANCATSSYQGDRISMHVFSGPGYWQSEADTYIAWPSAGAFPLEYFYAGSSSSAAPATPWSINLGASYLAPVRSEIVVQLTRLNDNATWLFNSETPQLGVNNATSDSNHLAVDDLGYGMGKAIIFRPNLLTLGQIADGDRFQVSLSGIKTLDGAPATLNFTVDFFDLQKAMSEPGVPCTVSFDSQGGSPVGSQAVNSGSLAVKPADPTRSGYIFVGWYSSAACTAPWDFTTSCVTGNQTLYARWLKTPVSSLTAQSASYGSIKLAWAASSGADYYEIYRATSSTGTYSLIKTLAASAQTYTDAGITTGKLYYYKIRAYAQIGSSKVFNGYSAIVSAKPVPAVPASFMVVSASYNSIKLSWAPVAGATGYKIYRATSSTGTYSLLRTTTATSYTNIYLTTGKAYYYKIRAYRTVGTASFYSGYTASLGTRPVPAVPAAFTVTSYSATSIKAAWSAVSGGSGYEVWRATSSTGAYSFLKSTTATSLTDTGLTTGRYYYYKVRAYHLEGTAKIYGSFAPVKYTKP